MLSFMLPTDTDSIRIKRYRVSSRTTRSDSVRSIRISSPSSLYISSGESSFCWDNGSCVKRFPKLNAATSSNAFAGPIPLISLSSLTEQRLSSANDLYLPSNSRATSTTFVPRRHQFQCFRRTDPFDFAQLLDGATAQLRKRFVFAQQLTSDFHHVRAAPPGAQQYRDQFGVAESVRPPCEQLLPRPLVLR